MEIDQQRMATQLANELTLPEKQVLAVMSLLSEGATIPFIARYRKEKTGGLDEVAIGSIRDLREKLEELEKRKETIIHSIEKQGKLTQELLGQIVSASTLSALEDLYLPYKPKRKTKASVAREKGLEPLAGQILSLENGDPNEWAKAFVVEDLGVQNEEEALAGARDIIAEVISEKVEARQKIRSLFWSEGMVNSKVIQGKEEMGQKFKDYFDWSESLSHIPSHRILAIRRGEKEGILSLSIQPEDDQAISLLEKMYIIKENAAGEQLRLAIKDGYKRLLRPSLETEIRIESKMKADEEAIQVFSENLKTLLLAPPLGQKSVLALDPGFRTGCKLVCLDRQGKLLHAETIYPHKPQEDHKGSSKVLIELVKKYDIEAVAIGNGTAGRETESFVKTVPFHKHVLIATVNESGASIYSASEVARSEFPDQDITVRGAVSIGRRLMDPLAETVKVDPKSIGVGQYQHDVDQIKLKSSLDEVVMHCVNSVGVDLNTASQQLLQYVAGLNSGLAKNIIEFRNEKGAFLSRENLLNVPRLGEKAYEQAAGFLRIANPQNPLDASAVHPERYALVEQMAKDLECTVSDLMNKSDLRKKLKLDQYVTPEVGLPTLSDILSELEKPGRDPRKEFEVFQFQEGVIQVSDLKVGMKLPGIVTNVTNFGAFVDIGVHQDGLVHISHLGDQFIKDPKEAVTVQQKVMVTVLEVDISRKRISLSMKRDPFGTVPPKKNHPPKKQRKEEPRIEDKLALLLNKYKK